jgi:hypothetical protein
VDAAVAAISASSGKAGAVVYIPAGTLYLGTGGTAPGTHAGAKVGVSIPTGLAAKLVIRGDARGASTIKLSANAQCAFYIADFAAYSTFQNVHIENLTVDNNNTTGRCHVLIGNVPREPDRADRTERLQHRHQGRALQERPL